MEERREEIESREFHLGDVLSITTYVLVSPRGMCGVMDILQFMTGEQLWDFQCPAAAEKCKPEILRQYPQLEKINASGVTPENCESWIQEQIKKYGEKLKITSLPKGAYQPKDPVTDFIELKNQ